MVIETHRERVRVESTAGIYIDTRRAGHDLFRSRSTPLTVCHPLMFARVRFGSS